MYLIAIIKTEIDLIDVSKTTIAGIPIVDTIGMITGIMANIIRGIETGTAIEITTVVGAIETVGMHQRSLRLQRSQSK